MSLLELAAKTSAQEQQLADLTARFDQVESGKRVPSGGEVSAFKTKFVERLQEVRGAIAAEQQMFSDSAQATKRLKTEQAALKKKLDSLEAKAAKAGATPKGCGFCQIASGALSSAKIMESEHNFACLKNPPLAKDHVLVIPKVCKQRFDQLPAEVVADAMVLLNRVSKTMVSKSGVADYNILQNNGRIAGQTIPHAHFELIPKPAESKGLVMEWKAKAGDSEVLSADAEGIAELLEVDSPDAPATIEAE